MANDLTTIQGIKDYINGTFGNNGNNGITGVQLHDALLAVAAKLVTVAADLSAPNDEDAASTQAVADAVKTKLDAPQGLPEGDYKVSISADETVSFSALNPALQPLPSNDLNLVTAPGRYKVPIKDIYSGVITNSFYSLCVGINIISAANIKDGAVGNNYIVVSNKSTINESWLELIVKDGENGGINGRWQIFNISPSIQITREIGVNIVQPDGSYVFTPSANVYSWYQQGSGCFTSFYVPISGAPGYGLVPSSDNIEDLYPNNTVTDLNKMTLRGLRCIVPASTVAAIANIPPFGYFNVTDPDNRWGMMFIINEPIYTGTSLERFTTVPPSFRQIAKYMPFGGNIYDRSKTLAYRDYWNDNIFTFTTWRREVRALADISLNALSTADNTLAPSTATKAAAVLDDSGVLLSNPVEGAIEVIKGTDQLNPNLDGGGFNFTRYTPLFGVIREKLFDNVFSHSIGRHSDSRVQVLLDTAIDKYPEYNYPNVLIRITPTMFGSPSGTPEVINISFDNQATWNPLWQANTAATTQGGSAGLAATPIDIIVDGYYNHAAYNTIIDTFNADGTLTTVKQYKQIQNVVTTNNIYLQFVLSGAENVGAHYQIYMDRENVFATP